jgi:RNA polymerase sigma-70 factor (ECF subfamily)
MKSRGKTASLQALFDTGTTVGLPDGQLLERFIARRDEGAFEALVLRHGPMVWGVCRRALPGHHDAEDAFQATFLVLARKAASVLPREMLVNWLYGVANRTALKARASVARRRLRERQVAEMPEPEIGARAPWNDLGDLLDRELVAMPVKYRVPIVLCDLEGKGHKEAAEHLGWPIGTLSGRLSRARAMLAKRLTRRGLEPSAGAFLPGPRPGAQPSGVPSPLVTCTVKASIPFAAGRVATSGMISAQVAALSNDVLGDLMMTKLKAAIGVCLTGGILAYGGVLGYRNLPAQEARGIRDDPVGLVARADDPAPDDAKLLEGEWRGVEIEVNGKKVADDEVKDLRMTFKGDDMTVRSASGGGGVRKKKFKRDPGKSPKAIDITSLDGQEKGQTAACIYSLEDGRLRICMPYGPTKDPGERPTEFKTGAGDGMMIFFLDRVNPKAPAEPDPQGGTKSEYKAILLDWEREMEAFWEEYLKAKTTDERRKANEKLPKTGPYAARFLKLAEAMPDTREGLSSLCWAVGNAPSTEPGKKALAILEDGRLARADLGELMQALEGALTSQEVKPSPLAPLVLDRVKRELDHPRAARHLTWVCANYYGDKSPGEPGVFAEAADILVDRFAASPGIQNFCESLGSGSGSPPWAGKYEEHLRTILDENQHRFVRCTALFALASVVQATGEARQDEAEGLYQRLVEEFTGHDDPSTRDIVKTFVGRARAEAAEIRARGIGKPAPEIEGEDLDSRPMKLSDFRGKVVLVSFWATWCGPCMKLIPHERALVARLEDKPFAIVGVNGDVEPEALSKAIKETGILWRSFQDKRAGQEAISVEWKVFGWPTLYLIDHRGVIRKRWIGAPPAEILDRETDQLVEAALQAG